MSTIDNADTIRTILENDGVYPGDPQCFAIYSYTNDWNKVAYYLVYSEHRVARFISSPYIHSPVLLWQRDAGLTTYGESFLKSILPQ